MRIRRARAPARESGCGALAGADPLKRAGLDTPLRGYSTSMWWPLRGYSTGNVVAPAGPLHRYGRPLRGCSTTVDATTPPRIMLIE